MNYRPAGVSVLAAETSGVLPESNTLAHGYFDCLLCPRITLPGVFAEFRKPLRERGERPSVCALQFGEFIAME